MKKDKLQIHILIQLFLSVLYTSTVAFGGGLVVVGMMRRRFAEEYKWFTDDEMTDLIAIAQSAPGAISGNTAMLIGYQKCGIPGAVVAMLGCMLPALAAIAAVSCLYVYIKDNIYAGYFLRGMRAAVVAVILNVSIDMIKTVTKKGKSVSSVILLVLAFIASYFFKVWAVYVILAGALAGILLSYYTYFRDRKKSDI